MPRTIVIFTYGAMGDFFMLLSLADALQKRYPDISVTAITTRNEKLLREMGAGHPVRLINLKNFSAIHAVPLLFQNNIVILPPAFGSAPQFLKNLGRMLSWRGIYVGFADKGASADFDKTLTYNVNEPYYENMLRAVDAAGVSVPVHKPRYNFVPNADAFKKYNAEPRRYIIIHPFAANPKRSFPRRRWQGMLEFLSREYPHTKLFITAGPGEEAKARALVGEYKAEVIVGEQINVLATLIKDGALYIGVDTGMTHLAALVRTPSVVIGNLSNPSWLPRYNEKGIILYNEARCTCAGDKTGDCTVVEDRQEYFRCLYDITDEQIEHAVSEKILA